MHKESVCICRIFTIPPMGAYARFRPPKFPRIRPPPILAKSQLLRPWADSRETTVSKNSLKIVDFKILKIPFVCFFLYPKDIFILNFRPISEKTAEEMSGNHSVHRRGRRRRRRRRTDGRTDGHDESNIPPYQLRWAGGIINMSCKSSSITIDQILLY